MTSEVVCHWFLHVRVSVHCVLTAQFWLTNEVCFLVPKLKQKEMFPLFRCKNV